jgi:hypothetical protein
MTLLPIGRLAASSRRQCRQSNAVNQPHQMNRDAKNIKSNSRIQIHTCKCQIMTTNGRWFDADGHVGKTAIKELRTSGWAIEYNKERGSYRINERAVA